MSKGGWVCKQVTVNKGQLDTKTSQDVYDLMVLFKSAIESGGIWELDTDIHSGANEGVPILVDSTNYVWTHGLYFKNAAGAKLGLTYSWSGTSYQNDNKNMNDTVRSCMGGTVISMIPPECGSFSPSGIATVEGYSPVYATPPVGTCGNNSRGGGSATGGEAAADSALKYMSVKATTSGWTRWSFLMRGNVFMVFLTNSWNGIDRATMLCCGEIVGECSNASDVGAGTRYGAFSSGATSFEAANNAASFDGGGNVRVDSDRFMKTVVASCGQGTFRGTFRKAAYDESNRTHASNGMWKSSLYCWVAGGPNGLGSSVWVHDPNIAGGVATWPLMVGFGQTYCAIVPGSGIKGYLDTEAFLGTLPLNMNRGQKVDGGNYVYVGGGLLVGWDDALNSGVSLF